MQKALIMSHRSFRLILILCSLNVFLLIGAWTLMAQSERVLTGYLGYQVEDPQDFLGESKSLYSLYDESGTRIDLTIPSDVLAAAGGHFEVLGQMVQITISDTRDGRVSVSNLIPLGETRWFTADPSGVEHWDNLLCKFSGVDATPVTRDFIIGMMSDVSPMMGHYWAAMGRGSSMSHTTTQWKTMPANITPSSDLYAMRDACMVLHGLDPNGAFNVNTFYNADIGAARGGYSYFNGILKRYTWMPDWSYDFGYPTLAHEMGHAYGMPHSNNSDGDTNPYDNPWDVMSGPAPMTAYVNGVFIGKPMNNYYAHQIGFINAADIYTLSGYGVQEVVIDHVGLSSTPNYFSAYIDLGNGRLYSIETRMQSKGLYQAGFQDYDTNAGLDGVLVYHIDPSRSEIAWQALAKTDQQGYTAAGILGVGESFTDGSNGVTVKVLEALPNGFRVQLSRADAITLLTPTQNEVVPSAFPSFSWSEIAGASQYQLTVVSKTLNVTFNFVQTVGSEACVVGTCSFSPSALPWKVKNNGLYQWSIKALTDSAIVLGKSGKQRFTVQALPPVLTPQTPEGGVTVSGLTSFSWPDDERVATWQLVLKNRLGEVKFKQVYLDADICDGTNCVVAVDLTNFKKGAYTWRVTAKHPNVIGKRHSTWRTLKIQPVVSSAGFRAP